MDIITHALVGLLTAAPFAPERPELAVALAFGAVLPDLDAFARVFGRRAFLAAHQTWSHALPVQAVLATGAGAVAAALHADGIGVAVGLATGMAVHSGLDLLNTLGLTILAPFSRRRRCLCLVFFIDPWVTIATALATVWAYAATMRGAPSVVPIVAWIAAMIAYALGRALLRRRALAAVPGCASMLPSVIVPWRFLAARRDGEAIESLAVDALSGRARVLERFAVHDQAVPAEVLAIPEVAVMRQLSPCYHAIGDERVGDRRLLRFRDMRTRNFGTRFGDAEIELDGLRIAEFRFHA